MVSKRIDLASLEFVRDTDTYYITMITLHLCFSSGDLRTVEVNSSLPVNSLEQFYPVIESAYIIHKGQIILPSFSFKFAHINDGDTINIIKHDTNKMKMTKPKQVGDFQTYKQSAIMHGMNPNTPIHLIMEATRLKDLYFMKKEANLLYRNQKNE